METKFIPNNFKLPKILKTEKFILRMLTADDVAKDYEAVMASLKRLKGVFGPENPWPEESLTFKQDLEDLKWHEKEFKKRSSFAYTVMNPDESRCLGCVYILPSDNRQYDAMIVLWVRKSELANSLDEKLFSVVQDWLDKKWPFKTVAYPGRKITWDKFLND
ncbi:MAG: GNAT family N-acetyltransferase [Patescibacteria group bacterium]|nr:GNAT family N-acetyltransferase [Patescibacteria group bacterium]MDD5294989.1 GNAT family N-acetyltransferase [Patescibacteria group bacterium]MDD5554543.1 GNAT family N-acetyltransferase [Patescibacteria group bacterium]